MFNAYCEDCERWMKADEMGIEVKVTEYSAVRGDRYVCLECKKTVVIEFGKEYNVR